MIFLSLSLLVPFGSAYGVWYDTDWQYAKKISVDSGDVDTNLTDFMLLINITDSDLSSKAQGDGDDIVFVHNDNSTVIKHEVEEYGSGWLTAWVRVNVTSASDYEFYMYYGNPTVGNSENPRSAWKNFEVVLHLNDDFFDSTGKHNGTNTGSTDVPCSIRDCQSFDGINDWIVLANDIPTEGRVELSFNAWVNYVGKGDANESYLFANLDTGKGSAYLRLDGDTAGSDVENFVILEPDASISNFGDTDEVTNLVWKMVGLMSDITGRGDGDGDICKLVDDVTQGCTTETESQYDVDTPLDGSRIADRALGHANDKFAGSIDEFQLTFNDLSNDYLQTKFDCESDTAYDSVNQVSGCISVGAEEDNEAGGGGDTVTVTDEIVLEDAGTLIIADGIVTVTDEIALEDAGTLIIGSGIVTVTDEIALEDAGATTIGSGIVTVTDEIVLEDSNIEAGSNAVFVSDEIVLDEDSTDRSTAEPTTSFNAIILSLNSPLLDRLGGVFALTCPANHTLTGLLTNGTLICTNMDDFFP